MEYVAVFQQSGTKWAGYIPDIPGCLAAGETREEAARNLQEAFLTFNRLRTIPLPQPHTFTGFVSTRYMVER